jgi:hypothetical protein
MFRDTGAQLDTMFENFDQKRPSCDLTRQIALVEAKIEKVILILLKISETASKRSTFQIDILETLGLE